MVNFFNNTRYRIHKKNVADELMRFLSSRSVSESSVFNIIFVGRRKMRAIMEKYKQEKETLPVLSFLYSDMPMDSDKDSEIPKGEIFICYPLAVLLAAQQDKTVDKMIAELSIHGLSTII